MTQQYEWAIIGAGPAGIAAVGKLIDSGILPERILWIDPNFTVGDFGTRWKNVSSNTRIELFTKFFNECNSYRAHVLQKKYAIFQANPDDTCLLKFAAEPLQAITDHFLCITSSYKGHACKLRLSNQHWIISLDDYTEMYSKNVILAPGAEPSSLVYPDVTEIPLITALNPEQLKDSCKDEDVIAVFGSSHSAIIVIKTLIELCNPKSVINFYRQPLKFAVNFSDFILFDDTGLKGDTAAWAKTHINGKQPEKLKRIIANDEQIKINLPLCNKVIYATGFKKRPIHVEGVPELIYNNRSGIIAPGLFGLGIAFPEAKNDRFGTMELRVGLWKFMDYLNRVLPIWLSYKT